MVKIPSGNALVSVTLGNGKAHSIISKGNLQGKYNIVTHSNIIGQAAHVHEGCMTWTLRE
jgi:hypothetical protein